MGELLRVDSISKKFGGLLAVQNLSFSVNKEEIFGIIGPNGAGKTTILNLISNIYRPTSGKVIFQGSNIVGYPPNKIARMGLLRTFQSTVSYGEATVWDNMIKAQLGHVFSGLWSEFIQTSAVREKRKAISKRSNEVLKFLGLEGMANAKASAMPYGYQKLLGLGMALAGEPRLMMLDEPAAGLNTEEKLRLVEIIRKINKNGVAIIIIEHNIKLIMGICHRVLALNYGQMIALGTPSQIQQDANVIKAYLGDDNDLA